MSDAWRDGVVAQLGVLGNGFQQVAKMLAEMQASQEAGAEGNRAVAEALSGLITQSKVNTAMSLSIIVTLASILKDVSKTSPDPRRKMAEILSEAESSLHGMLADQHSSIKGELVEAMNLIVSTAESL